MMMSNISRSRRFLLACVLRAQVIGAGFTISPLQPQFRHAPESHECLVTMVWNIDLGGFLSPNSYLGGLFRPLAQYMAWKFTGRTVQGLLCLRDYVSALALASIRFCQ